MFIFYKSLWDYPMHTEDMTRTRYLISDLWDSLCGDEIGVDYLKTLEVVVLLTCYYLLLTTDY